MAASVRVNFEEPATQDAQRGEVLFQDLATT